MVPGVALQSHKGKMRSGWPEQKVLELLKVLWEQEHVHSDSDTMASVLGFGERFQKGRLSEQPLQGRPLVGLLHKHCSVLNRNLTKGYSPFFQEI